jgi:hypothetical protein
MRNRGGPAIALLVLVLVLAPGGCVTVPHERILVDRMDLGQVIADSWKRQTLLNVVRMRYSDAPVFLDVASVISSYSLGGQASGQATIPSSLGPNLFSLGGGVNWSNTPTVTYQPLLGDRFTRSLLQPIPPAAVFQLMQSGWPVDLVMRTTVRSINGLRNDSFKTGSDAGFRELVDVLSRIQGGGDLGIRVEPRKDASAVVVVLRRDDADSQLRENASRARQLLGLDAGVDEFDITYGLAPQTGHEVAILSRSMLELLLELGAGVDLPAGRANAGRVIADRQQAGGAPPVTLVHIHSGTQAPADAYAAVFYKGSWYWIDDTDTASKSTFTFLLILSSLAETGQSAPAPVVTVPSR